MGETEWRGFGSIEESKHRELSSKGGSQKNPKKGLASLSKEERKVIARKGAKARWAKKKENDSNGKPNHPTEDQPQ